jgi:hypothetical protein
MGCARAVIVCIYLVVAFLPSWGGSVVINEILASNGAVLADEDGDYGDWIELLNLGNEPVDMEGYTLTDNPGIPDKWVFPKVLIPPKGFLLLWASGKDRRVPGSWDFKSPLILEFESAGYRDGDHARIVVNGRDRALDLRGINVVRLDPEGNFLEATVYDTWGSSVAAADIARYLESLSPGEIVIFAVKDEASRNLDHRARAALEALGSEYIGRLAYWDSWGMISVVGQGKLIEVYRPTGEGPAVGSLASKMVLHTNFKLDKEGEFLGLYAPDGTEMDVLRYPSQKRNVSYGRCPDGGERWGFFAEPTPGTPNGVRCAVGIAEPPKFSKEGGVYEKPVVINLSAPGDTEIHYTLDGSMPTEDSPRYVDPLHIEETTVVRARTFGDSLIPSEAVTRTFLIGKEVHLPVLSLATDPANLWDDMKGIYTEGRYPVRPNYLQHGREWERPVSVEFFEEDGTVGFVANAGIRIFGGDTRAFPKKSFVLYFRKKYGQGHLDYGLFPDKGVERFTSIVVRNAGNDGVGALPHIRDPLMHALWAEVGGLVSAKRSVFVFINGVPWGIYNLREHVDADYIVSNYGIEDFDLIVKERSVRAGDISHWDATLAFFEEHDLDSDDAYAEAANLIDIENFTDYQIFQIYGGNIDIWGNYIRFRPRSPPGRWRWVMWDMDLTFGLEVPATHNTLAWHTRNRLRPDLGPTWADGALWLTLILRKLLENDSYRTYFINRFADLLNTTLSPENVIAKIEELAAIIEPDIPLELARWGDEWGGSYEEWRANVAGLKEFAKVRPEFVRQYIVEMFGLEGTSTLTIEPPIGEGFVRVNTIMPTDYPWHGMYFRGVPVTLKAQPAPGYRFAGWSDPSLPQTATVIISLSENYSVRAVFTPAPSEANLSGGDIHINYVEITPTRFMQGDKFSITMNFDARKSFENVTIRYLIVDEEGKDVAYLESDFFDIVAGDNQTKTVEFKWTDLSSIRVGTFTLSQALMKQYPGDMSSPVLLTEQNVNEKFEVKRVTDPVFKKFISRENSLWWLTKMGWVNSPMAVANDLDHCVMYGGLVTGELTNEEFYADGSDIPCYWEITGYAVRTLALEYERTGNTEYRDLARRMADTIVRNLIYDPIHPENNGTIHTMDYYNGTEYGPYKDIAVIFDHAQIQMGLLELARVMEERGDPGYEVYQKTGERIGNFLYFVYRRNSDVLPEQWNRRTLTVSGISQDPMAVIGLRYLYENTGDPRYRNMARNELNRFLRDEPVPGVDYHGQSYFAYGMIKGFEWFGDVAYLKKAIEFAAAVSSDMDSSGKLVNEEYSRIPAQSQLIENNVLIWKYTGKERFLRWADKSVEYLTNTDHIWSYSQPVLKLGRYYRESGGQYNCFCYEEPELTSWGTIFHINAFYHYLHLRYGDIYVDARSHKVVSMISTPTVTFGVDEINIMVEGTPEGVGIYVNSPKVIKAVFLDGEPTHYFSDHTARTPYYEGKKTIKILLGEDEATAPHIVSTNSIITETTLLTSPTKFTVKFRGMNNTKGVMKIYWSGPKPTVKLDGIVLVENVDWSWSDSVLRISYSHDGNERCLTISADETILDYSDEEDL